ncbi:hypothetical protein J0S82_015775 [Galemys pyrenaicus]|uniref:Uncharacterized protein n=1 Tax=Galemys pyrenaicus TaxID=202257 RepID=A0A8J6DR71_GALPY|nr:hypothetical protein J0S82_015775 [Galemys pyrenaicus]
MILDENQLEDAWEQLASPLEATGMPPASSSNPPTLISASPQPLQLCVQPYAGLLLPGFSCGQRTTALLQPILLPKPKTPA